MVYAIGERIFRRENLEEISSEDKQRPGQAKKFEDKELEELLKETSSSTINLQSTYQQ